MSKITVSEVYWVTEGSPLLTAMTNVSPANGGRIAVEAHTDFPEPFDGETRTVVIDDEEITYTDVDEDTDELVNITRAANSTVAAAHTAGTFVQYGTEAKREKFAGGFIDDDEALSEGVEIARHLWRFYPAGQRDHEDMEVATVRYLSDDHPIVIDAPDDGDNPLTPFPFIWSIIGTLSVGVRPHELGAPFSGTIEEFYATMTEVADDDVIIDLLVEGVSVLDGSKLTIPAGETTSSPVPVVPISKALTKYQGIEIEVVQIGSTSDPGRYATIWALLYPNENSAGGRIEVPGPQGDPGTPGADGVITEVQDEGSALTDAPILDFTGAGVTATSDGSKYTVDIPGGGSLTASHARVETAQTTTSDSYTDLTTSGPAVTLTTGTSVICIVSAYGFNNTASCGAYMGVDISGATTRAAEFGHSLLWDGTTANRGLEGSAMFTLTGLTAGSNTFTAKYRRASGGTATFQYRQIIVIPL